MRKGNHVRHDARSGRAGWLGSCGSGDTFVATARATGTRRGFPLFTNFVYGARPTFREQDLLGGDQALPGGIWQERGTPGYRPGACGVKKTPIHADRGGHLAP